MRRLILITAIVIISAFTYFAFYGCEGRSRDKIINITGSPRELLIRNLLTHGGILIYPASDSIYSNELSEKAKDLTIFFRRAKLKIIPDTSVTDKELKNNTVFLAGAYRSNIILKKISRKLPIKFSNTDFSFNNNAYKDSSDLLTMLYRSPWNAAKLLYVISGNNNKYIFANMNRRLTNGINIFENGFCNLTVNFKINNDGRWIQDKKSLRDFTGLRKIYNSYRCYKYIVYSDSVTPRYIKDINEKFSSSVKRIKKFFNGKLSIGRTDCFIFDNFENKGLITGNTNLENTGRAGASIRMVINGWIKGDDFYSNALLILRKELGKAKSDFIERGLAMHFTTGWRGKGYRFWAALIARSGSMPGLNELMNNNKIQYISPLIANPLAGVFVDYLIKKYGKEKFTEKYKNFSAAGLRRLNLIHDWKVYLKNLVLLYKNELNNYKENFNKNIPHFQKGFCFAHVGYDIFNGYISKEAEESLSMIHKLGANSFSITPFTSMRNAAYPEPLRFWEFAGAENDESLIYLTHVASILHMTVMMKPQIYLGRSSWPGDIKMKNDQDWERFFHYYFNWISHYAMISEMYHIPILCVGNELEGATVGHEKEWLRMISSLRKLYNGKITYGANWNYEFENIKLWSACDYMGISEYFPISRKDNPTDADLYKGAESVMKKINSVRKKFGKPVILTEAGFRSSARPWKTAEEKSGRDSVNVSAQARCYKALFSAAYGKKWLTGMYWWKWPSYLSYGDNGKNNMYVPNNKPAQNVIKVWYSKQWNLNK